MRHSDKERMERSEEKQAERLQGAKEKKELDKTFAEKLDDACKKPIIKEMPFCDDEPPPVP